MKKKTLAMTGGAFVAGALCAFWAFGISEYRIEIPTKELYAWQADVLFLEESRGEFAPVAFTQEEKTTLLNALKNAKQPCRLIGLPEPIYEYPECDYFVKATIPFYYGVFQFFEDGSLLYEDLPEDDAERVREIILNVVSRSRKKSYAEK